jgi:GntR family transcriptional regulator/MocR family aminotransferase
MHIAATTVNPRDPDRVSAALLLSNVKVHSLSRYYLGKPTRSGLIFGYGAAELPEIKRGLSAVRAAFAAGS